MKIGLPADFRGVVKRCNCHSSEGRANFATPMVRELTRLGYAKCGVVGYRGALSSTYQGDRKTSAIGESVVSAKSAQVVIRAPAAS